MIDKIPDSLKAKLKGKEKQLEKAVLELKKYAKEDLGEQEEPVSEELEKAATKAFKQIVDSDKNSFLEIFKAGAKWKEEQMMKDAIDAEASYTMSVPCITISLPLGVNVGDKVKVIIIKSE